MWMHEGVGLGLMMLLFWTLVIAGIVFLIWFAIRMIDSRGVTPHGHVEETALDVLKKRYAKGEIDHEQYEEMKRDLEE